MRLDFRILVKINSRGSLLNDSNYSICIYLYEAILSAQALYRCSFKG